MILVALAAIALIVMRVVRGTPPRRRALAIGAPVALAFLVSQVAFQTATLFELQADDVLQRRPVDDRRHAIVDLVRLPVRADRGRALRGARAAPRRGGVAAAPGARRPRGDAQGAARRPSLRLAFRARGRSRPSRRAGGAIVTEIERDGRPAAAIVHDAELAEEPELLRAAGAVALLAQENAELEAGWNRSLRELRRSRNRIVAASEIERRKLERDLHDGAQQRLVALRIRLAIAREQAAAVARPSSAARRARGDLDEAIEELRDLAHGIFPSLLADRGCWPRCAPWRCGARGRSR